MEFCLTHPGRQKDKTEIRAYWKRYVASGDILEKIAAAEVNEGFALNELTLSGAYEEDVVALREYLTPIGAKRALSRFSQWASRSRRKKTTITITHETLSRLKQLSAQAGFEGESYDMMLEYLLETPQEFEDAKQALREFPIALSAGEQNKLFIRYLSRQHNALFGKVKLLVDHAYFSGWHDSRRRRGKRTYDHYESDLADFWSRTASNDD